jgi:putative NADPH-quinone reductase
VPFWGPHLPRFLRSFIDRVVEPHRLGVGRVGAVRRAGALRHQQHKEHLGWMTWSCWNFEI